MTSRVQKGSTVFRPVVKSRSRAPPGPSRQASVVVESSRGPSASHVLPDADFSSPSLPISFPGFEQPISYEDVTIVEKQTMQPPSQVVVQHEIQEASVSYAPEFTASRMPSVPPIVRSFPSQARSRSAIPTVISTPRSSQPPIRQSFTSTYQSSYDRNTPSSSATLVPANVSQEFGPSQLSLSLPLSSTSITSTVVDAVPVADPSSFPEPSRPQGALIELNAIPPIPAETVASTAKQTTRKRKASDGTATTRKPRKPKQTPEDIENSQDATLKETKPKKARSRASSRASSSTPRPRKRAFSAPPYDADADPGEDLDPTTVTMASLCNDTGQGRVSRKAAEILNNHAAWKIKNREKRARMKQLMEAKKYGRDEELEDQENAAEDETSTAPSKEPEAGPSNTAAIVDDTGSGFDYSQDLTTSRYNVQVRIGPNGETIIDEESLIVDRTENDGTENYTHVVESDQTKFVNSGTYGKRYRGSRWSAEETELFYDALSQYGENYELIAYVLPGRDRKSCKNKFKIEDKRNHARINHCLNNSIPVDMKTLSRMTGKDFSGPVPEIRASMLLLPPTTEETPAAPPTESPSRVKKRSRSRSRGGNDSGVVVLGDADTFESEP